MSSFEVSINLDNDAFVADEGKELGSILRGIAVVCEGHGLDSLRGGSIALKDDNGNRVGTAVLNRDDVVAILEIGHPYATSSLEGSEDSA